MPDAAYQSALPYDVFEEELIAPLRGVEMTDVEFAVSAMLLEATTAEPIKQGEIIVRLKREKDLTVNERQMRMIIRNLRRMHGFPICSRKGSPAGYWWGRTEAELEEFRDVFFAQIKDEAETVGIMLRKNFPRLAGQLRLDLGVEE
jgi:hypothetical protein